MAYIHAARGREQMVPRAARSCGGLVVGSFGLGAFVYNQLIRAFPPSMLSRFRRQILAAGAAGHTPAASRLTILTTVERRATTIMRISSLPGSRPRHRLPAAAVQRESAGDEDKCGSSKRGGVGYSAPRASYACAVLPPVVGSSLPM